MEQAAKRQDHGDEQQEEPAHADEQPFALLHELPGPLMRQLVQRHLDAKGCLCLLRTSHPLARAAVQHHTHRQRRALTWTWKATTLQDDDEDERNSMDGTPRAATAASLLVRWAPAKLHVELHGAIRGNLGTTFALPAAVLPLITSIRLFRFSLTPAVTDSLQHCKRLELLDTDECPHFQLAQEPARVLTALPLLRTFKFTRRDECKAWAIRDLLTLCAHATEAIGVPVAFGWVIVPQHLTRVTYWDALRHRPMNDAFPDALVQLPDLRRVRVPSFAMEEDHSHQACQWETLEVKWLEDVRQLLLLPTGIGRVVVTGELSCQNVGQEEMAAVLQRWAPAQLQARVDAPPGEEDAERWALAACEEERQAGFFTLSVRGARAAAAHASLLRNVVLPPGGGPHTLALSFGRGCRVTPTLQHLAPLLAGARVRTLCVSLSWECGAFGGVLSALPASITRVRLEVEDAALAREVLAGEAAAHALRVVVLLLAPGGDGLPGEAEQREEEQGLRELRAIHQPSVELEVVRVAGKA